MKKAFSNMDSLNDDLFEYLANLFDPKNKTEDFYSDYDRDEDGNLLSACCAEILDEDNMICPECKEHC